MEKKVYYYIVIGVKGCEGEKCIVIFGKWRYCIFLWFVLYIIWYNYVLLLYVCVDD